MTSEFERGVRAAAKWVSKAYGGQDAATAMLIALLPPAAPSGDREAVYWEHRLVIEGQVCGTHVSKSPNHDFGVQGEDFDPSAIVETAPLYAAAPAQPAEEKAAREAEAWHYEMGPNRMCYILHGYQVWAHVYRDPQTGEAGQIVRAEKIVAALSRARTGSEAQ